jgi:phosphatidylethanolamine/phosphatidyl-N-methylethanolamine N-methyltransferase
MIEQSIAYIKNLIKDPRVASVSPTSAHSIEKMLRGIDFSDIDTIVEYGPGDGVITRELLKRLKSNAKLFAIEINEPFAADLAKTNDERLVVIHGSAEDVREMLSSHGTSEVDLVLSGIPFSLIRYRTRVKILSVTRSILRPGGTLLVYQASIQLNGLLKKFFKDVDIKYTWKNIPPLVIFRATGRPLRQDPRPRRKAK